LAIRALDAAQLTRETPEADIFVDLTPPVMQIVSGPNQSQPVGPSVTFAFNDTTAGVAGSRVQRNECLLQAVAAGPAASAGPLPAVPQSNRNNTGSILGPGLAPAAKPPSSQAGGGVVNGRRLAESANAGASGTERKNIALAWGRVESAEQARISAKGTAADSARGLEGIVMRRQLTEGGPLWTPCANPVTFNGLVTATYSLQVRSTDAAGNQGPASMPYVFSVSTSGSP
jgi:hypothetical protein